MTIFIYNLGKKLDFIVYKTFNIKNKICFIYINN